MMESETRMIDVLRQSAGEMSGCICYVVAKDVNDDRSIWVTEVWDCEESHTASLSLPAVRATNNHDAHAEPARGVSPIALTRRRSSRTIPITLPREARCRRTATQATFSRARSGF